MHAGNRRREFHASACCISALRKIHTSSEPLPVIYDNGEAARRGGLIAYATVYIEHYALAADYVDRILKGAKPGDIPVQQPTKFELVINMKTAKALGLTIPQSLLLRADEVIQ
jgi:putative ABC transport system substrate-binding protein